MIGCGSEHDEDNEAAPATTPFPEPSELYEYLVARIAQVGSGHIEGELGDIRAFYEFTGDFNSDAAGDFPRSP